MSLAGPVGIRLRSFVLVLQRALSFPFGFLCVSPSREICFSGSLSRSLSFLPMPCSLLTLLL